MLEQLYLRAKEGVPLGKHCTNALLKYIICILCILVV
ncbi:hypothetical protein CLROS_039240 [Clostridium felsineum]|uniref:Uncharacterized protein n=1 Tax=Clostridium felsineum TaxID=36839 RepID=A0A9Q8XF97_9CLOT|nr:hypothetical protein CLROS_039240 [Clostridium felsineum]URZ13573.1 hypothetical protein CROST_043390 [Clostridium felsineum]